MKMCTPKFLRVRVLRFWEDCALIPFGGLIGGYVPLYLGVIVPLSFPNERCVPLNSGGFVPPTSGRIVPLSPLEDASPSILGGTVPLPLPGKDVCP